MIPMFYRLALSAYLVQVDIISVQGRNILVPGISFHTNQSTLCVTVNTV